MECAHSGNDTSVFRLYSVLSVEPIDRAQLSRHGSVLCAPVAIPKPQGRVTACGARFEKFISSIKSLQREIGWEKCISEYHPESHALKFFLDSHGMKV